MGMSDYEMQCEFEKDKAEFDAICERIEFKKNDQDKPRYSLIPPLAEEAMAKVLTFGAQKYSPDNWRKVDDKNRYLDAAMRHIGAYRCKVKFDDESGVHHLAHAMCCLAFIVELDMENMI